MRRFNSVRFRTTAGAAVAVAVALVVAAIGVTVAQERTLRSNLDDTLEQRADDLALLIERGELPPVLGAGVTDEAFAQVVNEAGIVVAASANIGGAPAVADFDPGDGREFRSFEALPSDDDPFRVLGQRFETEDGTLTLYVGASLDPTQENVAALRSILLLGVPVLAIVVGGVTWVFVGRALAPVEAIRREVDAIGAGALDRRVPEPAVDDEVGRLAATMNEMLERLEAARRRQQEFVADASHELRSPLTSIRAAVEIDLEHPEEADPPGTARLVLEESARLERLADDLLQLARSDAAGSLAQEPLDLDDVVFEEVGRLRPLTDVVLDTSAVSAAQLVGDRAQLARLVRNLLENAARHATSEVRVALREDEASGELLFSVTDDGPGVPADQRERIFERFARLDHGRGRGEGGTGLGLAIVRDVATRHGGAVAVDGSYTDGARFVVRLPLASEGGG